MFKDRYRITLLELYCAIKIGKTINIIYVIIAFIVLTKTVLNDSTQF